MKMKNLLAAVFCCALLFACHPAEAGDVYWIAEAYPAAFFMNLEDQRIESTGEARVSEKTSSLTFCPSLGVGLGTELGLVMLDMAAGAGIMADSMFVTGVFSADAALRWQIARAATIGPHIGVIRAFEPKWKGTLDVDMNPSTGVIAGLQLTMGDKVSYILSVDFIDLSFDVVSDSPLYSLNTDSLDMRWFGLQFGLRGQF